MSLYTYRWIPEQEEPEIIVGMEHVCADWSILADWAEKRSFPLKGHLLTSPYRGKNKHEFTPLPPLAAIERRLWTLIA